MMEVGYYPGCSLEGTAKDYRDSIEGVCAELEISLRELDDWNCCGATAAHSLDRRAAVALPGRNLVLAEQAGLDLVVPCALCFNRLKFAEKRLLEGDTPEAGLHFSGSIRILDLLDFMVRDEIVDRIEQRIRRPLHGLRALCYYGCMVNRPPRITDATQWENPVQMDRLVSLLGAQVEDWPFKTDCCGASHAVARPDLVEILVGKLFQRALDQGANCLVVSCQMCHANLDLYQKRVATRMRKEVYLPIFYFTELVGMAMGLSKWRGWTKRHLVDPEPLLNAVGLV